MLRAVVPINLGQKAYLAIGLIKTKKKTYDDLGTVDVFEAKRRSA